MGVKCRNVQLVPAFFRWLSEKYPKCMTDMVEEKAVLVDGVTIPIDATRPNPNETEFDNLYVDMNGIIHPCSHPEGATQPATEEEMYVNIMKYMDRLFNAVRPRRLLYMAVDGVAPRAKMNQQRSRRFKAAKEAGELKDLQNEIRQEMARSGQHAPPPSKGTWDSNVITPGTRFMHRLSVYLRFYIQHHMNTNKAWRSIKVVFSDSSEPGEGEHKIMSFIRQQRSQPGYDPNQHHVLHGLDADLIMLALATHEPQFTILRELVTFGRRDKERKEAKIQARQAAQDALCAARNSGNVEFHEDSTLKPLVMLRIWILREYLQVEFSCLQQTLPFPYDFERIIDDFVFLCFFVGNDFLPHLPSLDIRDGALDFLQNTYKSMLPSIGDYLTRDLGSVNLKAVSVIMAEVGDIEDVVFRKRHAAEVQDERRKAQNNFIRNAGGLGRIGGAAGRDSAVSVADTMEMHKKRKHNLIDPNGAAGVKPSTDDPSAAVIPDAGSNFNAAEQLRLKLRDSKRTRLEPAVLQPGEAEQIPDSVTTGEDKHCAAEKEGKEGGESSGVSHVVDGELGNSNKKVATPSNEEKPSQYTHPNDLKEAQQEFDVRVKNKTRKNLDAARDMVQDTVRLWEPGWKERYYSDKCKLDDIAAGGGCEKIKQTYIEGLCWIMVYYYRGVSDWTWFYPFHYAPFASDLLGCDSYEVSFNETRPFRPIEQLMAVLPPASKEALPLPCQDVMTDPKSSIIDFYPLEIEQDPNGKPMPWLWVVLLPFIDETRLFTVMESLNESFTEEEKKRNSFGPSLLFVHEAHPLFDQTKALSCTDEGEWVPANVNGGWSGTILQLKPENCDGIAAVGEELVAPTNPKGELRSVAANKVASAAYKLPPKMPHVSQLLPGVNIPAPTLLGQDLVPRLPPRLKPGMNIADIKSERRQMRGGRQPFAIHQSVARPHPGGVPMPPPGVPGMGILPPRPPPLGTGGLEIPVHCDSSGPVFYQDPQQQPQYQGWVHPQQQHHMFAPTGARQWGSMEPTPKRQRAHQQPQPPFSFSQNSQHVPPPPEAYVSIPRPPGQQVMPMQGMPTFVPMAAAPGNRPLTLEHLRSRLSATLRQKDQSS